MRPKTVHFARNYRILQHFDRDFPLGGHAFGDFHDEIEEGTDHWSGWDDRPGLVSKGEDRVIRQAISCDICGTEKKQTNHWFVAYESTGELRMSGWSSRNKLRPGCKHLCGQTCLHKLVDEFMARALQGKGASPAVEDYEVQAPNRQRRDASLTSNAGYEEFESSARLVSTPNPASPAVAAPPAQPVKTPLRMPVEIVAAANRARDTEPVILDDATRFTSRSWRAEAWERERERELRSVERLQEVSGRRRSQG